jgi:hypothetical protein
MNGFPEMETKGLQIPCGQLVPASCAFWYLKKGVTGWFTRETADASIALRGLA